MECIKKKEISVSSAPLPIGPYSQAVQWGQLLFVSGQLPIHPQTKEIVKFPMELATRQVLENIRAILIGAGSDLHYVLRVDIFLVDLQFFSVVNQVYGEYFSTPPYPARQTVQVAGLPAGSPIEISCIAGIPC